MRSRPLWSPVVALLLLPAALAGCLGAETEAADDPGAQETTPVPRTGPPLVEREAPAPDLPVGRAWTYAATLRYNPDTEFTVVVASRDANGYLFAAASEDDLLTAAVWTEEWYGPRDASLNLEGWHLLDFPLKDGKTWEAIPEFLTVTARAAPVSTPFGSEPGFIIEGVNENGFRARYEYAPSVGYLTSLHTSVGERPLDQITLTRMGDAKEWVWFERGPAAYVGGDHPWPAPPPVRPPSAGAAPFEVPAGHDALVVSAGGARGGRVAVQPPANGATGPWTYQSDGNEAWQTAALAPTAGTWSLAVQDPPQTGWGYVGVAAVKWVRGTL